jgi:hypothetical protein
LALYTCSDIFFLSKYSLELNTTDRFDNFAASAFSLSLSALETAVASFARLFFFLIFWLFSFISSHHCSSGLVSFVAVVLSSCAGIEFELYKFNSEPIPGSIIFVLIPRLSL